jgi:hypothetical protein
VQWLGGARSTTELLREPQNLPPEQVRVVVAASNPAGKAEASRTDLEGKSAAPQDAAKVMSPEAARVTLQGAGQGDDAVRAATVSTADAASISTQPATGTSQDGKAVSIPEHLQPLVQQQLNALETRQMLWQGNIWPGQEMQWEIHDETPQSRTGESQRQWVTQIQLHLPNLGEVSATLRFNSAGLNLTLSSDNPQTREVLGSARSGLVTAMADAGISVLGAQVSPAKQE